LATRASIVESSASALRSDAAGASRAVAENCRRFRGTIWRGRRPTDPQVGAEKEQLGRHDPYQHGGGAVDANRAADERRVAVKTRCPEAVADDRNGRSVRAAPSSARQCRVMPDLDAEGARGPCRGPPGRP